MLLSDVLKELIFEGHVSTDKKDKNYMIVYASQWTIAKELNLSREYVCHCINREVTRVGYLKSAKEKLSNL